MRGREGKSSTGANGCVHAESRDCILEGWPLGAISSNVEGESPTINHASCEGSHEALQEASCEASCGLLPGAICKVPQLRRPFVEPPVFVRTFGHFDIFVEGKPVVFRSSKEKELVALLVDRNGGTVTPEEAITCLWEDELVSERTLNRYRKLCQRTKRTLGHYGLAGLIEESRGVRSFNRSMVTCDYYEMMAGNEQYSRMFGGSYLSNYSWAESTLGAILRMMMVRSARNQAVVKY